MEDLAAASDLYEEAKHRILTPAETAALPTARNNSDNRDLAQARVLQFRRRRQELLQPEQTGQRLYEDAARRYHAQAENLKPAA